jgi:hypothetical protein
MTPEEKRKCLSPWAVIDRRYNESPLSRREELEQVATQGWHGMV